VAGACLGTLFIGRFTDRFGHEAASAGASSAYLTVSEIFPMETRALAIAFFSAIGTAVGGITGLFLFGKMIESGQESQVAIAFFSART
jgi:MFS family permease